MTAWFASEVQTELKWKDVPWPFWSALPLAVLVCVTGTIAALGDTLFPSSTLRAGLHQDFSATASFLVRLRIIHPFIAAVSGLLFATIAFFALRVARARLYGRSGSRLFFPLLCSCAPAS